MSARTVLVVTCDSCGFEEHRPATIATTSSRQRFAEARGWRVTEDGRDVCPECVAVARGES